MRFACLAVVLSLWATLAAALDVEDHRRYEGSGPRELRILSTADLEVFAPFLEAFHAANPQITLDYTVASSAELHRAIRDGAAFDLAISSAMDLQFQLVNDGFARSHRSAVTDALPDWARWRDLIFAFTTEPAVVVISTERFAGLPVPATRQELIAVLRDHPDRFRGAVGTYDVRESGLGYLFATQEARATDAYWRLSEVMGRLDPRLYCCSGQMIDDVANGRLALAYNVLGSYAAERLARDSEGRVRILRMTDFSNVILRTAIVPAVAAEAQEAGRFIDALLATGMRDAAGDWPLPPLGETPDIAGAGFGPIRLGPALMVYLDPLNRRAFLDEWANAIEQQ
ncbi:substrate-binding domain-containing protein [Roseibacterium sp. SDUM158017]|uniref:substrate-binding domain-containing protein n=1 Tax=Roseicyclus salinarum TaxID=3036773 RepID=UPI0024158C24|nr:substrate-binding domain-containing protein [Roseibacterium sp. SDUM158017]MDG4648143.1 substrate-binding domain-containing protein [Roseibacterium sp. SDUM158017]